MPNCFPCVLISINVNGQLSSIFSPGRHAGSIPHRFLQARKWPQNLVVCKFFFWATCQVLTQQIVTITYTTGIFNKTPRRLQAGTVSIIRSAGICRGMYDLSCFVPQYPIDIPWRPQRNEELLQASFLHLVSTYPNRVWHEEKREEKIIDQHVPLS